MNTVRIKAGAGCVEITHKSKTYLADDSGAFTIPADVASELLNLNVGVIVPDSEPANTAPAPSNVFAVSAFESVNLDMDTIEARTLLLELESHARLGHLGTATFSDSAGVVHTFSADEISQLISSARSRQFCK
ncbi:MAG TPA: hypothetical protein VFE60_04715 [Roseiarcus sp.]|jgi:hypothetical protein|nr:hypothetical protein [Roseiarcus sp.]